MRSTISRVFFGLLVILLGVGFLGNAFDWWDLVGFSGWWTLLLIVPAVFLITTHGVRFWNVLLLCVGVLLLLKEQRVITQAMIWPLIVSGLIILLGVRIVFGNAFHTVKPSQGFSATPPLPVGQPDYSTTPEYNIVFSSVKVKNMCPNLQSAKVSSVFGYIELDLTEIGVTDDIIIESSAVFGSVRIYAPRSYRIKVENSSVFGGCDNRAPSLTDLDLPLVTIKASTAFGGTEIL